jgi:hypothetical protein
MLTGFALVDQPPRVVYLFRRGFELFMGGRSQLILERHPVLLRSPARSGTMEMKCVKTRQNLIAFDLATNERLKNRGALRAWILPLDAIMGVSLTHRSAPSLLR